jgi:ATP-dependent RNA helicase RhlE
MTQNNTTKGSFSDLGIAPKLLDILQNLKFTIPTPIQQQAIPYAVEGKDVMGIAQTGTGKTLAFGVPMIQRLAQSGGKEMGLVVLPTRELALQVDETLKKIGASIGLRTAILIGGEAMPKQNRALAMKPHIIIATPGRLIDHLEGGRVKLDTVRVLVLDEADRMLDMGFAPQLKKILQRVPAERQTMLFSATMPDEIVNIAKSYMRLPLRVEVAPAGTSVETVAQEVYFVHRDEKTSLLKKILAETNGSALVFSRTKHGAKKIAKIVRTAGISSTEIHSNRSLNQRLEALDGFKIGKYRVMVATDIAARGIDVKGLQLVINYDLPSNAEDYVHRIGRTGRAGMTGRAISFATPDQRRDVKDIERLIRKALAVTQTPTLERAAKETDHESSRESYFDKRPSRGQAPRRFNDRRPQPQSQSHSRNVGAPAKRELAPGKRDFGGPSSMRDSGGSSRPARSFDKGRGGNSRNSRRPSFKSKMGKQVSADSKVGLREESFYLPRKRNRDVDDQF